VDNVTENEPEKTYPIKTMHEFLSELDKEWSRFKSGSLASLFIVCTLLLGSSLGLLGSARTGLEVWNLIIFPFAIALLLYVAWAMVAQYRFYRRWERRMRLLVHLEEELISGKLDKGVSQ